MEQLVKHVLSGKCIVYPTTTQPALGCILQSDALDILYEIKKRDYNLPLSIAVCDIEQAKENQTNLAFTQEVFDRYINLMDKGHRYSDTSALMVFDELNNK